MNTSTFLLIAIHLEILHISANQDKIVQCRLYIVPVIMYRADVWILTVTSQRRLDAFDQWCLRHILSIPYTAQCQ